MSEFRKVDSAQLTPSTCAFCGTHEGPFIDTGWETTADGHVYICCHNDRSSGCVRQFSRFDDMIESETFIDLHAEAAGLRAQIEQLESQIKDMQVVPLSEVLDHLRKSRPGRKPATPREEVPFPS